MKACDRNIIRTLELTREMIRLADQGDAERDDTGCGVLYGILRDSAYKLQRLAEEERERHQNKRHWPAHCQPPHQVDTQSHSGLDSEKEEQS